jgi:hypothetical protein
MGASGGRLEAAAARLERAVTMLDQRLAKRMAESETGGLFDQDRARLAADLDASRARERELLDAGAQASSALQLAIDRIGGSQDG